MHAREWSFCSSSTSAASERSASACSDLRWLRHRSASFASSAGAVEPLLSLELPLLEIRRDLEGIGGRNIRGYRDELRRDRHHDDVAGRHRRGICWLSRLSRLRGLLVVLLLVEQ